ncbi:hypothetical protein M514_14048 [Trichuris suis]|uniref:Uncharacterized protein n=1 Tax=Trichuris suis TaxID=68888 RepID=A0A085NIM1_9BILA|nr:hypothetical protein M513_14048 [Trichuris suis]KFD69317.1 hypothetical protein M514_14048 [Trichuris suis]
MTQYKGDVDDLIRKKTLPNRTSNKRAQRTLHLHADERSNEVPILMRREKVDDGESTSSKIETPKDGATTKQQNVACATCYSLGHSEDTVSAGTQK